MPFQKLAFKPGVNREISDYANEGGWHDCDKIRFRAGLPENIGGWVKYNETLLEGAVRALFNWSGLDGSNYLVAGTATRMYFEEGGTVTENTPVVFDATLGADPIDTADTTTTLTINATAHNADVGSYVIISGATAVGGIPDTDINKEHTVVTVPTANSFTIEVATTATSTASGGGASVNLEVLVSPGSGTSAGGLGWGAGPYSRGGYGTPYATPSLSSVRLWSIDAYGEDLFMCVRDGEVFYWDASGGTSTRPVELSTLGADVPVVAKCVLVSSSQRRAFAFGCNPTGSTTQDPLLVRWSTTEDITGWTPAITNSAGEIRLDSGSQIITAVKNRQEYLIWTESSLYGLQDIGIPDYFGVQSLASNLSIMSPNAVAVVNGLAFWMGRDKFYVYSGAVNTLPCAVLRYVFTDINMTQAYQFFAGTNEAFNEVIWFYCSASSSQIDRYVAFNHLERIWYYGTLSRTAWLDTPLKDTPVAAGVDGYLYSHEIGTSDGSADPALPVASYIESSPFDLGEGDSFVFARSVIPDVTFKGSTATSPTVTMTITPRNNPGTELGTADVATVTRTATSPVDQFTQRVWIRLRGRQATFKIASNATGVKWQLGAPRIEIQPDGRRA